MFRLLKTYRLVALLLAVFACPTRAATYDVIHDQLTNYRPTSTYGTTPVIATSAAPGSGQYLEAADDFTLATSARIAAVRVHQIGLDAFPAPRLLRVTFYADDARTHLPGAPVCQRAGIEPVLEPYAGDAPGVLHQALLTLPQPCDLAPGAYWFSVQMDRAYDVTRSFAFNWNGYVIRANTPAQQGRPVVLRGQYSGIADNCAPWQAVAPGACFGFSNNTNPVNMMFQLLVPAASGPGNNGTTPRAVSALSPGGIAFLIGAMTAMGLLMLALTRRH